MVSYGVRLFAPLPHPFYTPLFSLSPDYLLSAYTPHLACLWRAFNVPIDVDQHAPGEKKRCPDPAGGGIGAERASRIGIWADNGDWQ